MSAPLFERRTTTAMVAVATASFLLAAIVGLFFDDLRPKPHAASNSFSLSALGHRAFVELLEEADVPVTVSRSRTAERAGPDSLVVVVEPDIGSSDDRARLRDVLRHHGPVLVVLPKRRGYFDSERPDWVRRTEPFPRVELERLLDIVGVSGRIARPTTSRDPVDGPRGIVGAAVGDRQLVRGSKTPTVWTTSAGAMLLRIDAEDRVDTLGEDPRTGGALWVLTDPDPIENHGLDDGDNARVVLALVDELRGGTGAVLIDETVHGFIRQESIWRALLEFPLVLVLVNAVLFVVVVLLATTRRFGPPERVPVALAPGKRSLLDNTARLLAAGNTRVHVLTRYFEAVVREVRRELEPSSTGPARAGGGADEQGAVLERLRRAGRRRGVTHDPVALEARLKGLRTRGERGAAAHMKWVDDVHEWREEIRNGP